MLQYDDIIVERYRAESNYVKCLRLSCDLADCLRESRSSSIKRLIVALQEKGMLVPGDDLNTDPNAQHLIFDTTGWISMLFTPSRYNGRNDGSNNFKVAAEGNNNPSKSKVSIEKAGRPLDELLRSFGNLLPTRHAPKPHRERQHNGDSKFHVSFLNVATMKILAGMELVWVDSLSSHLVFDPTVPSLSVFKCPSFCRLQSSDDSLLSMCVSHIHELK